MSQIAQLCQSGIRQILKEHSLNSKKYSKNYVHTHVYGFMKEQKASSRLHRIISTLTLQLTVKYRFLLHQQVNFDSISTCMISKQPTYCFIVIISHFQTKLSMISLAASIEPLTIEDVYLISINARILTRSFDGLGLEELVCTFIPYFSISFVVVRSRSFIVVQLAGSVLLRQNRYYREEMETEPTDYRKCISYRFT